MGRNLPSGPGAPLVRPEAAEERRMGDMEGEREGEEETEDRGEAGAEAPLPLLMSLLLPLLPVLQNPLLLAPLLEPLLPVLARAAVLLASIRTWCRAASILSTPAGPVSRCTRTRSNRWSAVTCTDAP